MLSRDVLVYIFKVADFKTQIVMLRVSKIFKKSYITDIPLEYFDKLKNIPKSVIESFTGLETVYDYFGCDLSGMRNTRYLQITKHSKLQRVDMPYLTRLQCVFDYKFDFDNNYFPSLETLSQSGYANLNFIEKHKNSLKVLGLGLYRRDNYAENVKHDIYNTLEKMTNLTTLNLNTTIEYLPVTLTNLQALQLLDTHIKNIDFSHYKNICYFRLEESSPINITNWSQSIVSLCIDYIHSQNLLESIIVHTNLQKLVLKTNNTTNLEFLQYCTNLSQLCLSSEDNADANLDFKYLTTVTNLNWLSVRGILTINDSHIRNLTKLKTLRIENTFITDNALANLQLTELFTSSHITDFGIKHMTALEELYIFSPHIQNIDSLTNLKYISVKNNKHITSDYLKSHPNRPKFHIE